MLSYVSSKPLLWSEQVLAHMAQEKVAWQLMINAVGERQGRVPQKNVVSAAKPRGDCMRGTEEEAATEESTREASPLTTQEHTLDHNTWSPIITSRQK